MLRKVFNFTPADLVEFTRSGLVEQICTGLLVKVSLNEKTIKIGSDNNYPFFLRSCAKPMQASILIDLGCDKFYDLTPEEIALCCSSHSGEENHIKIVKNILKKANLDETYLHCGVDKPLSKAAQEELIINGEKETQLHNNCSGKHAMMLAICKKMNWDLDNYYEINHPLQQLIKKKIYELCEITEEYPITKDGCGVPICSMPLENMAKGFLNLFLDEKYLKIRNAFLLHPELVTGVERLDNAIMGANKKLIMKGGAGGLGIILNLEKKECLVVKMTDFDSNARAITIIEALKQLGWLDESMLQNELVKKINNKDFFTLLGEKIGKAEFLFDFEV